MFPQLENYKNPSLKLKTILQALYDQVKANRNLAHFFLSVHSEALILDVQQFSHFVMVKPDQLYREPLRAQKSSMPDIQVTSTVFEEIYKILVQILKDNEITEDHIPSLSFDILEIVEESRAQFSDSIMMVLKMEDVTQESMFQFFNRFKFDAQLGGKNEVSIETGIDIPVTVKVRPKDKSIVLIGKAVSVDKATIEEVEEIAQSAVEKYPIFPVQAVEDEDDWPFLFAEHHFSYENGVPVRLLFRLVKSFASSFQRSVKCDLKKVLAWNVENR